MTVNKAWSMEGKLNAGAAADLTSESDAVLDLAVMEECNERVWLMRYSGTPGAEWATVTVCGTTLTLKRERWLSGDGGWSSTRSQVVWRRVPCRLCGEAEPLWWVWWCANVLRWLELNFEFGGTFHPEWQDASLTEKSESPPAPGGRTAVRRHYDESTALRYLPSGELLPLEGF